MKELHSYGLPFFGILSRKSLKLLANASVIVHLLSERFGIRDPNDFNESFTPEEIRIADIASE